MSSLYIVDTGMKYMSDICIPSIQIHIFQIVLPIYMLPFHFINGIFQRVKVFNFLKVKFIFFLLWFVFYLRNNYLLKSCKDFLSFLEFIYCLFL